MKLIDLTLTISENIPTFPGSPVPHFIQWSELKKDRYNLELLFFSSHTGTHIDAPYHFVKKGKKIHQLEPSRFLRESILIRVSSKSNYSITRSDIVEFEKKNGKIPIQSTVVFFTGWNDGKQKKHFEENPGLDESAANYLVSLKTNMVCIDTPSIDAGKDLSFPVHKILLKNNILILENLCNLGRIKSKKFNLLALPLKLYGATGSPVRALAF